LSGFPSRFCKCTAMSYLVYLDELSLAKSELVFTGLWIWRHCWRIIVKQGNKDSRSIFQGSVPNGGLISNSIKFTVRYYLLVAQVNVKYMLALGRRHVRVSWIISCVTQYLLHWCHSVISQCHFLLNLPIFTFFWTFM
jgi:hypothetical protein